MRVIRHKRTAETRSILEARWAMFFREFNLRWKYEPLRIRGKGFQYTPDFEVVGFGYVEIKPTLALFIEETADRLQKASLSEPDKRFFVFCAPRVEFSRIAMYQGGTIYAPTTAQILDCISVARPSAGNFSRESREADIKRAMGIANSYRFSEWRTSKEILMDVLDGFTVLCRDANPNGSLPDQNNKLGLSNLLKTPPEDDI